MNEKYGFEDIMDSQRGIFGSDAASVASGSAMDAFQQAERVPTDAGMAYKVMCENGHPTQITVEWPELVAVKNMISPHIAYQGNPKILQQPVAWGFDAHTQQWFPDVKCGQCGWPFRLMIPMSEIDSGIRYAIGKGLLPEMTARQLSGICQAVKQRVSGG